MDELILDRWSNAAALGYAIAGAGAAGLSDKTISKLVIAMTIAMDNMTVEDAASYYINGDY